MSGIGVGTGAPRTWVPAIANTATQTTPRVRCRCLTCGHMSYVALTMEEWRVGWALFGEHDEIVCPRCYSYDVEGVAVGDAAKVNHVQRDDQPTEDPWTATT